MHGTFTIYYSLLLILTVTLAYLAILIRRFEYGTKQYKRIRKIGDSIAKVLLVFGSIQLIGVFGYVIYLLWVKQ